MISTIIETIGITDVTKFKYMIFVDCEKNEVKLQFISVSIFSNSIYKSNSLLLTESSIKSFLHRQLEDRVRLQRFQKKQPEFCP